MDRGFATSDRIVLSLILCGASLAFGQNASVLPPSGVNSSSSSAGSGGVNSVDYSVSGSVSVAGTDSAVTNVGVMASSSALTASDLAAGQAGGGPSAHQSTHPLGGSLSGGDQSPPNLATSASRSGSSRGGSLNSLRAAASASSNVSGVRRSLHPGQGVATLESGLTGHELESATTGAKLSSAQAKAGLSEEEARSGSGAAAGSGQYATGFPDSTKNTAIINPPDLGNDGLFIFSPAVSEGFPDLAEQQFLQPTFHISGGRSSRGGSQDKEDLYRRIERRLKEYREAEAPKNGLKPQKRSHPSSFDNPFAEKPATAEDKLNKPPDSGLSF